MKKYVFIIFLFSIILTGCFGGAGKGDLESVCTKTVDTTSLKETDTYTISYKEGNVKRVILTKKYTGMDITASLTTYQRAYENSNGVHIVVKDSGITADFDMGKVNDELMKTFNLKKTYNEQVKLLEDIGFTCE